MEIMKEQSPLSRTSSESLSVEMERDAYKEKIEHFKLLIAQLQMEIQSHKVRKEGAETMSRLLQESKQEAVHLQKKNRTLETVIRNLQIRLEKHGLSSEITLQEGETYIPGQSKQLLDNLTRENTRLRGIIRKDAGDPEELSRLQQGQQQSLMKIAELEAEKNELHNRVIEVENVLNTSDNEKDLELSRLREQLRGTQVEVSNRDRLCTSLAAEATTLKQQLKDVALKCQELAHRLDENHEDIPRTRHEVAEHQTSSPYTEENTKLKLDNEQMKASVIKITEMNKRWQDYNQQRETHVKKLQAEVAELKSKVTAPPGGDSMMRDMNEQVVRIMDEAKRSVLKANEERDKFKRDLAHKHERSLQLVNQVQQLTTRLNQAGRQTSKDDSETIAALKTQIQICTEDFESERRDRENAQEKLTRCEEEKQQLKLQLEALQRQVPQVADPQQYARPFYHYDLPGPHGNFGNEGLAARGVAHVHNINRYNVIDGVQRQSGRRQSPDDIVADGEQTHVIGIDPPQILDDNCSSLRASSISSSSDKNASSSARSSPVNLRNSGDRSSPIMARTPCDILKCPKCSKEYTTDQHAELLEHIEICCE